MAEPLPTNFDALVSQYGGKNAAPAPQTQNVPATFDDLVNLHRPRYVGGVVPMSGEGWDDYFSQAPVAHVLDAFGEGVKQGWGTESLGLSPETESFLQKAGIINDYRKGQASIIKSVNEAFIRPAATALSIVEHPLTALGSLFSGASAAVAQIGQEVGAPRLGRSAAGFIESGGGLMGSPGALHVPLGEARSLGVIGEGEAGYFGTAEQTAARQEAIRRLAPSQEAVSRETPPEAAPTGPQPGVTAEAPTPETPPDIHAVARQIAPDTFQEFDALAQRKDTFSRWLDELGQMRDQTATADLDQQIAETQAKLEGATGQRVKPLQSRLADLTQQRDQALEDARSAGDTPDMQRVRQALQQTDFRMRDLAPDVSAAYRSAREQIGPEPAEEAPENAVESVPASTTEVTANAAKPMLRVAQRLPDGKIDIGLPGQTHGDLPEAGLAPGAEPGFVSPDGQFLTRDEAMAWLDKNQPKVAQDVREDQEDYALSPDIGLMADRYAEVTGEAPKTAPVNIAQDVSQKLTAAGRPQEEADAAAAIVAAHYEARAARLGTTADDLYTQEGPSIEAAPRGRKGEMGRTILQDGRTTIRLMANADASTFMHETGHQWLEELMRDAQDPRATPEVGQDASTVRDWLGAKEGEPITRVQHEKFARGFERYLMEGVAPSQKLAGVFEKFRAWLTTIYQTVARLRAPISDDIRDVFDRLITTKPERATIVAGEKESPKAFADRHEELAETTPPEQAAPVADEIRAEADSEARKEPKVADRLNPGGEVGGNAPAGAEPHGNGDAGRPLAEGAGAGPQPGAVGPGGGEAAPQGAGVSAADTAVLERPKPARGTGEQPTSPNAPFPEPAETRLVDKAGNIRLDNLGTPEDVNQAIREAANENEDFIGARRGVISDAQVLDLADALGMDAAELSARKLGQAFNAEQIIAARKLLIQSATTVRDAMAKAAEGSDADVMAYAEAKARHRMIQEQVAGITAEAGRALRAFRSLEGSETAKTVGDFLQDATGQTLFQLRREAKLGATLDTPSKVSKFVHDSEKPGFGDMVLEYWINGLISGPATHTTYSVGNALLALWKAGPETAIGATIGALRRAAGNEGERVMMGEVGAQAYGMMKGARDGVVAAWQAAKSGVTTPLPGELESLSGRQLANSPLINPKKAIPNFTVGNVTIPLGSFIRLPSRGIAVIHSFFRAMNYEREMAALAYRKAATEGLTGDTFARRVGEITQNPDADLMSQARASATDLTLMGRGGELTQALSRLTNAKFMGFRWLKFVDPFVHISSNVIEQAVLQRTPAGFLVPEIRDNLLGKNGKLAQDTTIARMVAGSALGIAIGSLAAEGLVNGSGPSNPREAAIYSAVNGPAHSVRIGDTWYDVHRLGPLGMLLGISADLYEVGHVIGRDDASNVASLIAHAFTQNILDESFMRGPADLIRALTDHERYGAAYVRNMVSSFTPFSVGMAQTARAVDPYSREARTILDSVKRKIPWLSETLLPRRDIFGEPIPNKDALGVDGLSAIYEQKANTDPVYKSLLDIHVFPAMPKRSIRGVELSDQQYDDYSRIAGRMTKMRLDAMVRMPGWPMIPTAQRVEMVHKAISTSREAARSILMMQNPDIISRAIAAKTAALH